MNNHAFFAPSASSRWMSCTASMTLDISHIEKTTSFAAELGTALHEAGEQLLLGQIPYGKLAGYTFNGVKIDKDQVNNIVRPYVAFVNKQCEGGVSFELFTEEKAYIADDCWGTADAVILIRKKNGKYILKVIDLKTGAGHKVSPIDNSQLLIYAAGVYQDMILLYDIDEVQVGICQPPFDVYAMINVTIKDLVKFNKVVLDVLARVEAGDVVFAPSEDTCRWCPAASICPKLNDAANEAAKKDFSKIPATSAKDLSEQMMMVPLVEKWLSAVKEEATSRLMSGKKVKGWKTVRGRSSRAWKFKEDVLIAKLKAAGIPKSWLVKSDIASPPQLEKILKDKGHDPSAITKFVKTVPGNPVIAQESDSREAWDPNEDAKRDFKK